MTYLLYYYMVSIVPMEQMVLMVPMEQMVPMCQYCQHTSSF